MLAGQDSRRFTSNDARYDDDDLDIASSNYASIDQPDAVSVRTDITTDRDGSFQPGNAPTYVFFSENYV